MRPPPETEARRARRCPPVSRAPAGCGIAARRPPRWNSLRRGKPPGPGKLNPKRSSGPPSLPAAPGRRLGLGSRGSDARPQAGANKGAPGENAPPFPAAPSAAGSPGPRRVGPPPLPGAGPRALRRHRRQGPGALLRLRAPAPAPAPACNSNLKSWSSPREPVPSPRDSLPLSALQTPRLVSSEQKRLQTLRGPRAAPARRRRRAAGPAGEGRRLGGPEPSLRTPSRSLVPRTKNKPCQELRLIPSGGLELPSFSDPEGKTTFPPPADLGRS